MFKNRKNKALAMMKSMVDVIQDGITQCKEELAVKKEKVDEIEREMSVIQSDEFSMTRFLKNLTNTNNEKESK